MSQIRAQVLDRDGSMCAGVGVAGLVHGALTEQHRLNKQMGGSLLLDGFENLMCLCIFCNERLEQDAAFASLGRAWGWKLIRNEDPARVAVWFAWARQWRLLDKDGAYLRVISRDGRTASGGDPFAGWRETR